MTAFDGLDLLDARVVGAIDEIAAPARPDYLDDVFAITVQTRQRPRWTFPGRWLPSTIVRTQPLRALGTPIRTVALLLILALLAAIAALVVGSQRHVPPPFGPAANGALVYSVDGDIMVRDDLAATPRVLIAGSDELNSPSYSLDGRRLLFADESANGELLMAADADGRNVVQVMDAPLVDADVAWSPDSQSIAVVSTVDSFPTLFIARADGSGARMLIGPQDGIVPVDLAWRPPDGQELLVRAWPGDGTVAFYLVRVDGSGRRRIDVNSELLFGAGWDLGGPVFSPDGTRVAYNVVETDPESGYTHFRVHVVDVVTGVDVAVSPPADVKVHESWPQFSPDGKSILVHRWTWSWEGNEGWLAVLPADGSAPARDVGPRIEGGEETGLTEAWSPDGSRILMRTQNTTQAFSINPATGKYDLLDWTTVLPDWQRTLP